MKIYIPKHMLFTKKKKEKKKETTNIHNQTVSLLFFVH